MTAQQSTRTGRWYHDAVFYQVFVKCFFDANGDGIGDIQGLISKLDYIKRLGVKAIYLNPLTQTPSLSGLTGSDKDCFLGYESTDLQSIHSDYGNFADFRELTKSAHHRDLKIIIDFITIAFSPQHPFFKDVLKNGSRSLYAEYFKIHRSIPPGDWLNFQGSPWNPLSDGSYYYALWRDLPFLNYRNADLVSHIYSTIDFWMSLGVDGIRVDAAKYLFSNGPSASLQEHQPETLDFLKVVKQYIKNTYGEDKVLLGEIIPNPRNVDYGDGAFDLLYDGVFAEALYGAEQIDVDHLCASYIEGWFYENSSEESLFYISNHDRGRVFNKLINASREKKILIISLLLLSNGIPMIYYGDELGLTGATTNVGNNPGWFNYVSTMAWDNSPNGGYTKGLPRFPVLTCCEFADNNVELQEDDQSSVLNHCRRLIALRNTHLVFAQGLRLFANCNNESIYAYFLTDETETVLVVHNLSCKKQNTKLDLPNRANNRLGRCIFENANFRIDSSNSCIEIEGLLPYSSDVFILDGITRKIIEASLPDRTHPIRLVVGTEIIPQEGQTYRAMGRDLFLDIECKDDSGYLEYCRMEKRKIGISNRFTFSSGGTRLLPLPNDTYCFSACNINKIKPVELTWKDYMDDKLSHGFSEERNSSLKGFYYGYDPDFWYLSIERGGKNLIPFNGGLDFAVLFHDPSLKDKDIGLRDLSFWLLPKIVSALPINHMLIYQDGAGDMRPVLYTDACMSCIPGTKRCRVSFFSKIETESFVVIPRSTLSKSHYKISILIWSAGGNWLEKPPPRWPIVEILPRSEKMMCQDHRHIQDYLDLCTDQSCSGIPIPMQGNSTELL